MRSMSRIGRFSCPLKDVRGLVSNLRPPAAGAREVRDGDQCWYSVAETREDVGLSLSFATAGTVLTLALLTLDLDPELFRTLLALALLVISGLDKVLEAWALTILPDWAVSL